MIQGIACLGMAGACTSSLFYPSRSSIVFGVPFEGKAFPLEKTGLWNKFKLWNKCSVVVMEQVALYGGKAMVSHRGI